MCFSSFFQKPHYKSEVSLFLEQLHQQKPSLAQEQREGRALLWDKTPPREPLSPNLPHPDYKYYSQKSGTQS